MNEKRFLDQQLQHRVSYEGRAKKHVALCSCGWESRPQETEAKAADEGSDHLLAVVK